MVSQKTAFEKCPRCGGDWQDGRLVHFDKKDPIAIATCFHCKMECEEDTIALKGFLSSKEDWTGGFNLCWDIAEHKCFYGNFEEIMAGKALQLPWLPYTISKEKFKLYLLFS